MIKKLLISLISIICISNCFIPSSFAEKENTESEEMLTLALWSIVPLLMDLSLLSADAKNSSVGLASEFLVVRDNDLNPKVAIMPGIDVDIEVLNMKTSYPIVNGKVEGLIHDMGFKIPFIKNKSFLLFGNLGASLGRYYKNFAWGGYSGLGCRVIIEDFSFGADVGYRNLNSKGLINTLTLSGSLGYRF